MDGTRVIFGSDSRYPSRRLLPWLDNLWLRKHFVRCRRRADGIEGMMF